MDDRIMVPALLARFRDHLLQEEKSAATVEKYLRDVRTFLAYAEAESITKELTVAYKHHLLSSGYAIASVNSMLASLNSLLRFAGLDGCRVKFIRQQKQTYCAENKELTKAEYLRLLTASRENEQLYFLLQTICATGIRVSELRHFTVEMVRTGTVRISCKGKTRAILIPDKLRKALLSFAKKEKIPSGAIFLNRSGNPMSRGSIWAKMKALCEKAGVEPEKVFPHNLRKLFARLFYRLEKDIAKLADVLGHSSINTTRIYIMTTGVEHRRQLERLGLVI